MRFNVGFATDIGLKRQKNQDAGGAFQDLGLFIVADGMGGHRGGEIASAMVIEVMPDLVRKSETDEDYSPRQTLNSAIQAANRAIFERALKESELEGMGTTTTALLFKENKLTVGHVGDSRAYFIRPNAIWQITRDHSFVQEKLRAGLITRDQARNDQTKNVITRSVGFGQETNVETYEMQIKTGDIFLICSDGLSGQIEDKEILDVVQRKLIDAHDMKNAVDDLVSWANARGGHDNITVVLIQVQ